MQKYSDVVLDANGKAISGAVITVVTYPGGLPATIYAADGGPAVPTVATNSNGRFAFYAANGHYSLIVTGTGITPITYNDITLFDPNDLAASGGAALVGWARTAAGAVKRWVSDKLSDTVSVKDFGAVGDGVTNDTAAILAAKAWAIANLPATIRVPKGTYLYTDIGNWAYSGLSLIGESHRASVFKCTGTGAAFTADAFKPGLTGNDATAQFVQGMNVSNITFQAANTAAKIVDLQGLARCSFQNVFARNADSAAGIAFHLRGVMLTSFYNIGCSTQIDTAMASIPYEGLRIEAGTRNSVSVGNCSNNTFVNPYMEGLSIGMRLSGADQNVFMAGSAESNSVYDLLVATGSRYNTFIGTGFESLTVTANVSDAGTQTRLTNCYANKKVYLAGRNGEIEGGYYQRIEVQAGAVKNRVIGAIIKNWESSFPGTGGFFDSGTATEWKNLFDTVANAYSYPLASRTGVTVGASPFQWQNTTGQYVEVIVQTGTLTQVRILRSGDSWLNSVATPGKHLLAPSDTIELSYSVAPGMSYVPHNGFQG